MSEIQFTDDIESSLSDNNVAKKWVRQRADEMERWRKPFEKLWQKAYKYYRSYPEPKDSDWKATLFVPRTFEVVETILPRLIQSLFGQRPSFAMLPIPDETAFLFPDEQMALVRRAKEVETLIDTQLEDVIGIRQIAQSSWFKFALIFGGAPAILSWDPATNQPKLDVIDVYDFWCDPRAEFISNAQDAMHEIRVPIDLVRKRAQDGIYDAKVVEGIRPDGSGTSWPANDRLKSLGIGINEPAGNDRIVILREYWRRSRVITYVKSSGEILRNKPNTLYGGQALPYAFLKNVPVPKELYGMGWPEIMESLQLELNDTRNLRIDNVKLAMNRMFAVTTEINEEVFVAAPGAIFKVNDPQQGFRVIEIPDLGPNAYQEEERINADLDRTTGIHEYSRGQKGQSGETATGINLIVNEANVRFGMLVSMYEAGILDMVKKLYLLNKTWQEFPTYVRTRSDQGIGFAFVSEDAFDGAYDVAPVSTGTLGSKDVRRQQLIQLMQTVQTNPQLAQMTDFRRLYEILLNTFDLRDVAGIMKSQEQIQQEMMQQQAAMVQGGGMPGPGASPQEPAPGPPQGMQSVAGVPSPTGVPLPIPGPNGETRGRMPAIKFA